MNFDVIKMGSQFCLQSLFWSFKCLTSSQEPDQGVLLEKEIKIYCKAKFCISMVAFKNKRAMMTQNHSPESHCSS